MHRKKNMKRGVIDYLHFLKYKIIYMMLSQIASPPTKMRSINLILKQ